MTFYSLTKIKNFPKNEFINSNFKNKTESGVYLNNLFIKISDQLKQKSLNYNHFFNFWKNFGLDSKTNSKIIKVTFLP